MRGLGASSLLVGRGRRRTARRVDYRAGVEEWEEPLHLGSLPARYPTFPHNATLIAHFFPQPLPRDRPNGRKVPRRGAFPRRPAPAREPADSPDSCNPPCKPGGCIVRCGYDRLMRVELGQRRERGQRRKPSRAAGRTVAVLAVVLVALAGALAGCGSS